MKVPLSWLKEFLDLSISPTQIAKTLTSLGIEVEGLERFGPGFSKVVVGKVLSTEPHPNADKLCIAQVSDGTETYRVVCGAPNCRPGLKTALALLGAEITEEGKTFKVKKSKIRGEESYGMLCSGKELGISAEDEGILEFADNVKEGLDLAELYSDTVFEAGLTPNLGHAHSIVGIARELAASLKLKLKIPPPVQPMETAPHIKDLVRVKVEDPVGAPRYACRLIEGVKIAPSPSWLKKRLEEVGIRSVNNVVDITNYVLTEWGQPLHAFDFDKLAGHEIRVRQAKEGEKIETLDGKTRELPEGAVLICDADKPVAVAGLMGGANTEVTEGTTKVLIESAYFAPASIRRSSKKLMLQSDSSRRFERGADPNIVLQALNQAALLMQQLASGEVREGVIDVALQKFLPLEISCRVKRVNDLLGTHLGLSEVENIFSRLGFEVISSQNDVLKVKIPTYRNDITSEIDLVEEVARLVGYDTFTMEPSCFQASQMPHSPLYPFEKVVRAKLIAEGLQEFLTCDLIGKESLGVVYGSQELDPSYIHVLNPVSVEQSILRQSLMPGLLQVAKHNIDRESRDIAGFEVGRIHFKDGEKFKEQTVVAIILSGLNKPYHFDPKTSCYDFLDLKGILENFLKGLGIDNYQFKRSDVSTLHPGKQASIFVGGLELGTFGAVHPSILRRLDVSQKLFFAELNLQDLFQMRKKEIKMTPLMLFPASQRDWTVTLIEEASVSQVIDSLKSIPSPFLEEVSLFDIYRSPTVGNRRKNATFRFIYRDKEKTIDQETVDKEHARLIESTLHLISGCLPV